MPNKTLIFDFDGTIADTFQLIVGISNRLSQEFHYHSIKPEEIDLLKDMTTEQVIRHLRVPMMKIPMIVAKAKVELQKELMQVEPIEGLQDILVRCREAGIELGILSSNSAGNIEKFLKRHRMDYFDFVVTTSRIWSKNHSLNGLLRDRGLRTEDVVYIGDEVRDIAAARKSGVKVAAVTWGYNSPAALKAIDPDYLIDHPEDLLRIVSSSPLSQGLEDFLPPPEPEPWMIFP